MNAAAKPAAGGAVIEVQGLCKRFGRQKVHDGLDLEVRRGECVSVIGRSGSGKSTLLHQIIGLVRPDAGSIRVLGATLNTLDAVAARRLRQRWGVLFQNNALFSAFNVFDNLAFPMRELRKAGWSVSERTVRECVALKLHMVGLDAASAWKHPAQLSGGMQKRVALARALMLEAELLFLDEPTTGLDPAAAAAFDAMLGTLHRELGLTVVMVTHDLYSVGALSDRVAVLAQGSIATLGTVAEVARSGQPFVRDFFRARRDEHALRDLPDYREP